MYHKYSLTRVSENIITLVMLTFLLLILTTTCIFTIYNASFTLGDNVHWLLTIAQGNIFSTNSYMDANRFFPLAGQQYNWMVFFKFKNLPLIFYIENTIIYIATILATFLALRRENFYNNFNILLLSLLYMLCLPGIITIYLDCNIPEIIIVVCFALFLFFSAIAEKNNRFLIYLVAAIFLIIATYIKEAIFSISFIIGVGQLIFYRKQISRSKKYFSYLLILNSVCFLVLYVILVYLPNLNKQHVLSYASEHSNKGSYFSTLLQTNAITFYLYVIPILFAMYRFYKIIFKKDRQLIRADLLLCSGIVYSASYIILNIVPYQYYHTPALFLIFYSISIYLQFYFNCFKVNNLDVKYKKYIMITLLLYLSIQSILFIHPVYSNINAVKIIQNDRYSNKLLINELCSAYKQGNKIIYIPLVYYNDILALNQVAFNHYVLKQFLINNYKCNYSNILSYPISSNGINNVYDISTYIKNHNYKYYNLHKNQILIINVGLGTKTANLTTSEILKLSKIRSDSKIIYIGNVSDYFLFSIKSPITDHLINFNYYN